MLKDSRGDMEGITIIEAALEKRGYVAWALKNVEELSVRRRGRGQRCTCGRTDMAGSAQGASSVFQALLTISCMLQLSGSPQSHRQLSPSPRTSEGTEQ